MSQSFKSEQIERRHLSNLVLFYVVLKQIVKLIKQQDTNLESTQFKSSAGTAPAAAKPWSAAATAISGRTGTAPLAAPPTHSASFRWRRW